MAFNYMDTLDTSDAARVAQEHADGKIGATINSQKFGSWNADRNRKIYETEDIKNPELKKYVDTMREYIARDDYINHVRKCISTGSMTFYSDDIDALKKEAITYKSKAQEQLNNVNINALDNSDFLRFSDVQCNANNIAENLKAKTEMSATLRATVGNLDPNQTATVLNRLSPKAQKNFMTNVEALYPDAIPDKNEIAKNTEEAINKLLNEKPRPDFTDPMKIKDCISSITNDVHIVNVKNAAAKQFEDKNTATKSSKHNTSRYDVSALTYGTLTNDKTDLDFGNF